MLRTIYYHNQCYDGVLSAAMLAAKEHSNSNTRHPISFVPVGYSKKSQWLNTSLSKKAGIVDFLFHPDASFWADHHPTAFIKEKHKDHVKNSPRTKYIYQPEDRSCARTLYNHFIRTGYPNIAKRFTEKVKWGDIIDAAQYDTIGQVLFPEHPAIKIERSLEGAPVGYVNRVISYLKRFALTKIINIPNVQKRYKTIQKKIENGHEVLNDEIQYNNSHGIVMYQVQKQEDCLFHRYSPFYFKNNAPYALTYVGGTTNKVRAMRNPWIDFSCINIGQFINQFGGGGHKRVGATYLDSADQFNTIKEQFIKAINTHHQKDGVIDLEKLINVK